ncbi:hypothetical protein GUJ93_ZPchr0013g35918 [Zizania palustris]|uniref:Uncharacterized protein n=1 Tax=Zizania palustris TaxID=103762 RepID=A0A8J5X0X1_ZIZPA|nr:hypothetical protein GUJ93_ZPchr0013g35918 [Zizania palustris]
MRHHSSAIHATLLLAAALVLPVAAAQPWEYCGSGSSGTQSNTYRANLLSLGATLRRNLSTSNTLFASGTIGAAPDAVYGLVLCSGDLSAAACVAKCTIDEDVKQMCNTSREGVLVYNVCSARFSAKDFLISQDNSNVVAGFISGTNITSKDVAGYSRAVSRSPSSSTPPCVLAGPVAGAVPDRTCLDDLLSQWFKTQFSLNGKGARLVGARCNLRSETQPNAFYNGSPLVLLRADALPPPATPAMEPNTTGADAPEDDIESVESSLLSLESLRMATHNFDESNKLGEGGFGAVYKGFLSGQEVAVKRLSKGSNQGLEELKNELVLVAKLHHRNLVQLVGFCLEEGEKLLVYEYMSNKSLDTLLFDEEQRRRLNWEKRFKIIEGVARGLLYLHQDSQKKIIHRDMKASNVLLDSNMNPKIGDFGLAKLFGQDQTQGITKHVAGTLANIQTKHAILSFMMQWLHGS